MNNSGQNEIQKICPVKIAEEGTDMRSIFYDIHRTVTNAVERAGDSVKSVLNTLGISRS